MKYITEYYDSIEEHYHWGSGGYQDVKGYEFYADLGAQRKTASAEQMRAGLIECSLMGTPDDIVQKIEYLGQVASADEIVSPFIYGKMPFEKAEAQMKLFLEEALPRIHKLPVAEPLTAG